MADEVEVEAEEVQDDEQAQDDGPVVAEDGDFEQTEGESEGEGEAVEETQEPESEPQPEVALPTEADLLRLQLENERAEKERWKRNHDELTGKLGPKIKALREENELLRRGESATTYSDGDSPAHAGTELETLDERLRRAEAREVQRAMADAHNSFRAKFPAMTKLEPAMVEYVTGQQERIKAAAESRDAEHAAATVNGLLTEAMMYAMQKAQTENKKKADTADAAARSHKKIATPAGQGSSRRTETVPKTADKMTPDELKRALRAQGRKGF